MKLSDAEIVGRPDKPINVVRRFTEPTPYQGVGQLRARACVAATFIALHDESVDLTPEERAALELSARVWRRLS